jgi:hypothetical protein
MLTLRDGALLFTVRKAHNSGRNHVQNVIDYYNGKSRLAPVINLIPLTIRLNSLSIHDLQDSDTTKPSRSSIGSLDSMKVVVDHQWGWGWEWGWEDRP